MVTLGETTVEPVAAVEVKEPGAMEIDVAPVAAQVSVALDPELMVAGLAVKEVMEGGVGPPPPDFEPLVVPEQPVMTSIRTAGRSARGENEERRMKKSLGHADVCRNCLQGQV